MVHFWNSVIRTQCSCIYDEKIWFFSNEINALLYLDKETMEPTYVTSLNYYKGDRGWLFTKMIPTKDSLILIPYTANDIVIYYPEKNQYEKIELNTTGNYAYFISSFIDETTMILFPAVSFEYYYFFDLSKKTVKTYSINLKNILVNKEHIDSFMSEIYSDGYLYTNVLKDNKICRFEIKTSKIDLINIGDISINSMCYQANNDLLLLNGEGDEIYRLNKSNTIEKTYKLNPKNKYNLYMRDEKMGYSDIKQIGGNAWAVLPMFGNDLIFCEGDDITRISLDWDKIKTTSDNAKVFAEISMDDDNFYLLPFQANTIVKIEKNSLDRKYFEKEYKNTDEISMLAKYYIDDSKETIYEDKIRLKSFIEYVEGKDEIRCK